MDTDRTAGNNAPGKTNKKKSALFKVSPYMVIPSRVGGFSLYLKQDESFVLYAEKGELFTDEHKKRLGRLGVDHLYVKAEDYSHYAVYLHDNLLELLDDDAIPVRERARAWNDATVSLAKEAFDRSMPHSMDKKRFARIRKLINSSLKFLARDDALKELARFISEGNQVFRHGIAVMVLTVSVLSRIVTENNELLVAVAIGSMLHDIGKLELPEDLFARRPSTLSQGEIELIRSHPALGVGVCSSVPLPQEALQCILFHHERMDGSGYPSGGNADLLPFYVKALILCNEYDNLLNGEGEARKRHTPFEALTRIKSRGAAHDQDMLKLLIEVLSKAELT
ncbi:metal-dependent phosphohydrolase [Pseudodesulfovibrio cashew]|uniref:Metal-dependent phosphohydrolase n=1 Tax=Pseudodesulfovibrio cashew TaxID=2678688 RepID=A0A6I6JFY3_9BACT|nr:HD domain-containing phosphohydrolase [Pseudodesulfovibrio cashew]QGY39423.1 metal-dependent phosphohydrolase [Pseudodesulfovibrio cashew]